MLVVWSIIYLASCCTPRGVRSTGGNESYVRRPAFTFTPSVSLFVDCADEEEFDRAFGTLSEGGSVLMPPDNYGFSTKFVWLNDRFGVSWQLNLP